MRKAIRCRFCGDFHPEGPLLWGPAEAKLLAIGDFADGGGNRQRPLGAGDLQWFVRLFGDAAGQFRLAALSRCRPASREKASRALEAGWLALTEAARQADCVILLGADVLRTALGGQERIGFSEFEGEWLAIDAILPAPAFVLRHPRELSARAGDLRQLEDLWLKMREMARFWRNEYWRSRCPAAWVAAS